MLLQYWEGDKLLCIPIQLEESRTIRLCKIWNAHVLHIALLCMLGCVERPCPTIEASSTSLLRIRLASAAPAQPALHHKFRYRLFSSASSRLLCISSVKCTARVQCCIANHYRIRRQCITLVRWLLRREHQSWQQHLWQAALLLRHGGLAPQQPMSPASQWQWRGQMQSPWKMQWSSGPSTTPTLGTGPFCRDISQALPRGSRCLLVGANGAGAPPVWCMRRCVVACGRHAWGRGVCRAARLACNHSLQVRHSEGGTWSSKPGGLCSGAGRIGKDA